MKKTTFLVIAILALTLAACAGAAAEQTATTAPTVTAALRATDVASAAPTEAPAAQPTPLSDGEPNPIPHSIEDREACDTCHGLGKQKPYPPDHAGKPNQTCTLCHTPPADVQPTIPADYTPGPLPSDVSAKACLGCHGPFEDLMAMDLAVEAGNGSEVNPHIDVPHGTGEIPECSVCHAAHPVPPTELDLAALPKADVTACYGCHHTRGFEPCGECHEQVPHMGENPFETIATQEP